MCVGSSRLPQSGAHSGNGASSTSSICSGEDGWWWALGPWSLPGLRPGFLGWPGGGPLAKGGGLALAGAGRLVELTAEALVLGLQVAEASLQGLAAGTRDGLHTPIMGEARATAALPRPRSRDQLELDALNKYIRSDLLRDPSSQQGAT
jgi:hypothetical protein